MQTLSARTLHIEEWERNGLIELVGELRRGEKAIDMCTAFGPRACAGAHIAITHRRDPFRYITDERSDVLVGLFYPGRKINDALKRFGVIAFVGSLLPHCAILLPVCALMIACALLARNGKCFWSAGYGADELQTAAAIENFLTTGKPQWWSVMRRPSRTATAIRNLWGALRHFDMAPNRG